MSMTSLSPEMIINCNRTGDTKRDIGPGARNWICANGICGWGVKVAVGNGVYGSGVRVGSVGRGGVMSACKVAWAASPVMAMRVGM